MARLLIHVKGQTEERFIKEVLRDHLVAHGYFAVDARLVGNARSRAKRGGIRAWPGVRTEIANHLRQDPGVIATTMVDYYALPSTGDRAWPGRDHSSAKPRAADRAEAVESAIAASMAEEMGPKLRPGRFVPFVLMHEFEALLFSDCHAFAQAVHAPDIGARMQRQRDDFESPEEIDDSPETAPSKRIQSLLDYYEKPLMGVRAAQAIGLATIRHACPHFDSWLQKVEALGSESRGPQ